MTDIQAVVFDIGRVLMHWDPEGFYDREIGEDRRRALFTDVDLHGMNDQIDLGWNIAEAVATTSAQHPEHAEEIQLWHKNWLDMASPDIPESAHMLRRLKARGTPVFALTNFGVETFRIAEAAYPVLREFDKRFVSGHLKVMKPDPRIYEIVEQGTGVAPQKLLFIDDKPENIATAEARGWQTHLFTGPGGLGQRLLRDGLLEERDLP